MYEKALRDKYRYPFKGSVSTEDLWDLSVEELDSIFKVLSRQSRASQDESLLSSRKAADTTLADQIEIVKHIVAVKLAEEDDKKLAKEKRQKKAKLTEILAMKQDQELQGKSAEEIQAMIDTL